MDYLLDRIIRIKTELEHPSLYSWSINEIDENKQEIGPDQIPWAWSLYFKAKKAEFIDSYELDPGFVLSSDEKKPEPTIQAKQIIRLKIHPNDRDEDSYFKRPPQYKMFGSDREIKDFQLIIRVIDDPEKNEYCSAWGSPSYVSEGVDFLDETTDDIIIFHLFVHQERFDKYANLIKKDSVSNIEVSVGHVDGFYSGWSPTVITDEIKVLTRVEDHRLENFETNDIVVPALGSVDKFDLNFCKSIDFDVETNPMEAFETTKETPNENPQLQSDPNKLIRLDQHLKSIKFLAKWIVGLLCLITAHLVLS